MHLPKQSLLLLNEKERLLRNNYTAESKDPYIDPPNIEALAHTASALIIRPWTLRPIWTSVIVPTSRRKINGLVCHRVYRSEKDTFKLNYRCFEILLLISYFFALSCGFFRSRSHSRRLV